ncbi:hypothetical protein [Candidatus Bandiella euplotis]|uniref:PARP-type domain-containing protein n=1 Tax=Candidatus Bandiella euplotis TaxID=1664265 RepID=A0ABZ0UR91_9RICK|nr:hypothetical protein [Candidatus Bandiella woodruffii]WPX97425.1 hypothetical protein Bandiella_01579 [Candidatus Bandiella woodruffii]
MNIEKMRKKGFCRICENSVQKVKSENFKVWETGGWKFLILNWECCHKIDKMLKWGVLP